MLILVEGPNLAGKTTLVDRLVTQLAARASGTVTRLHRGPIENRHPLDEYVVPLLDYHPGSGDHVVCDRWHVGESVYPFVYPRPSKLDRPTWLYITAFLRARGALLVHRTALPSVLRRRLLERGDENLAVNSDNLRVEKDIFEVMCAGGSATGNVATMRIEGSADEEVLRNIRARAQVHEISARKLAPFVTYVGPPNPTFLLFGDVRGGPNHRHRHTNDPAFGPYPNTSGYYLLRALDLRTPNLTQIGIANACDVDDPVDLWETLGRPRVAALGRNAARLLRKLDAFPFGAAPHPQFIRRFHHAHHVEYGRVVMEALLTGESTPSWQPY